jgi:hypothetical protein
LWVCKKIEIELELAQTHMTQKSVLCPEAGARVPRMKVTRKREHGGRGQARRAFGSVCPCLRLRFSCYHEIDLVKTPRRNQPPPSLLVGSTSAVIAKSVTTPFAAAAPSASFAAAPFSAAVVIASFDGTFHLKKEEEPGH